MSEIVSVVLDAQIDSDGQFCRILVQGVFLKDAELPPKLPGADRNIVDVFLGANMRSVSAFRIDLEPEQTQR